MPNTRKLFRQGVSSRSQTSSGAIAREKTYRDRAKLGIFGWASASQCSDKCAMSVKSGMRGGATCVSCPAYHSVGAQPNLGRAETMRTWLYCPSGGDSISGAKRP